MGHEQESQRLQELGDFLRKRRLGWRLKPWDCHEEAGGEPPDSDAPKWRTSQASVWTGTPGWSRDAPLPCRRRS
jgi:hypothetical protein